MTSFINLANGTGNIKFHTSNYPDGQKSIHIDNLPGINDIVYVLSRISSAEDLLFLCDAVHALQRAKVKEIVIKISYLFGARSDRKFEDGESSYLVDTLLPMIASLNVAEVQILDVHNPDVVDAVLKNFVPIPSTLLVKKVLTEYLPDCNHIVCPDNGASKKIYSLVAELNESMPDRQFEVLECIKHRTKDGITINAPLPPKGVPLLVVDDIGDGFGTFMKLADAIERYERKNDLFLFVTHSIQAMGMLTATTRYKGLYTTNSFKQWRDMERVKIISVI